MAVRFGTPSGVVLQEELESVQKREARFVTGNDKYDWEYDWHSWTVKMGIPQEKEERQKTYTAIIVSKVKPVYQQIVT